MKMNIDVEIVPFRVPLYVRSTIPDDMGGADNNYIGKRKYLLEELSLETLESLCSEFRLNVLKAAKKCYPETEKDFF